MKFLLLILFIHCFGYSKAWGLVWLNNKTFKNIKIHSSEKTATYILNDRKVHFTYGTTNAPLEAINSLFKQNFNKKGSTFIEKHFRDHLLSCVLEKGNSITQLTKEEILALKGECLFAKRKKDRTHFQNVRIEGFPDLHQPKSFLFEGVPIELNPNDQYLHLETESESGFSLFALRKKENNQLLNSWKNNWQNYGWKDHSYAPSNQVQMTKDNQTLIAKETDHLLLVLKK